MKKVAQVLIVVAAIVTVIAIISQFIQPVAGMTVRGMIGFAGLLLLFAIASEGLK